MNQTAFWKVSIRTNGGLRQWDRYFTFLPTVQEVCEAVQSESGDWTAMLELLDRMRAEIAGAMSTNITVAGTVIGFISIRRSKAYTK